jgi:uncharacterized cupin superfamily protein
MFNTSPWTCLNGSTARVVLVTDSADTILEAGDYAAFKAGNPRGTIYKTGIPTLP